MMDKKLPIPSNENERLLSVFEYGIIDSQKEERLDAFTALVASIFRVPIALITILDEHRQWFKSNYGLGVSETQRSISFCQYTIAADEIFEVQDTWQDETFKDNPLVSGSPNIRYYCGAPLKNERGFVMGSLAIIDNQPRRLDGREKEALRLLAAQVVDHFELNMRRKELQAQKESLERMIMERTSDLQNAIAELKKRDAKIVSVNNELNQLIYKASHDLLGPIKTIQGLISLGLSESETNSLHQYLNLIGTTTRKLDQALVNLLKLVTIKDPCEFSLVVWDFVVQDAVAKARKRTEGKTLSVSTEVSSCSHFHSDGAILEMVLEELFVNSFQYNRNREVKIKVKVRELAENVILEVKDNGIGLRAEERERMFEMFFKNAKSRGSGLGLYMVKSAVERLNGSISAHSETNNGTTVKITLPLK